VQGAHRQLGNLERREYRVDLHVHSDRSHAADLRPAELVAEARAVGLHAMTITEHNMAPGFDRWAAADSAGGPCVIPGQEVVTPAGHWLAVAQDSAKRIPRNYDLDEELLNGQIARVHQRGGLCIAAHPFAPYPSGTLGYPLAMFDAVEVW
jgi:predicted metal-dependent phosphoesterase TrpH